MKTDSRPRYPRKAALLLMLTMLFAASAWFFLVLIPDHQMPETLRIGYAVEAPYAFVAGDGRVTGEAPEIARVIAARLGVSNVTWRQMEFSSLLPELAAGHIDMIAAGMFFTPERNRAAAFSHPTFHVQAGLLVASGNPRRLHSYDDLLQGDVRVAVLAGSAEEDALRSMAMPSQLSLLQMSDAYSGARAVQVGDVDAFALSTPSLQWLGSQLGNTNSEIASPFTPPAVFAGGSSGGFMFHPRAHALRERWNQALLAYIGSPEHLALVQPFGLVAGDLPGHFNVLAEVGN